MTVPLLLGQLLQRTGDKTMFRDKSANHVQAPKPKPKSKYVLGAVLLMNLGIGWAVTAGFLAFAGYVMRAR
jgi:hypothetical protein